MDGVGDL